MMEPNTIILLEFKPDAELEKFAAKFAKDYQSLKVGTFMSAKNNYRIDYVLDRPITSGPVGVTEMKSIVELDRTFLTNQKFHEDTIFFLIMWCYVYLNVKDRKRCDEITLKYYFTTKRSLKILWKELLKLFQVDDEKRKKDLSALGSRETPELIGARMAKMNECIKKYGSKDK